MNLDAICDGSCLSDCVTFCLFDAVSKHWIISMHPVGYAVNVLGGVGVVGTQKVFAISGCMQMLLIINAT